MSIRSIKTWRRILSERSAICLRQRGKYAAHRAIKTRGSWIRDFCCVQMGLRQHSLQKKMTSTSKKIQRYLLYKHLWIGLQMCAHIILRGWQKSCRAVMLQLSLPCSSAATRGYAQSFLRRLRLQELYIFSRFPALTSVSWQRSLHGLPSFCTCRVGCRPRRSFLRLLSMSSSRGS